MEKFVKIKTYLKKLNWYGFFVVLMLAIFGTLCNKSVTTFVDGTLIVLIIGFPFSLFFLFAGKED